MNKPSPDCRRTHVINIKLPLIPSQCSSNYRVIQIILLVAIEEYLDEGHLVTKTAMLTYHKEDGQWYTDYADNNFLNAMTGGLSTGYQYLYEKMLSEYQEVLEGSSDVE